MKRAGLVPGCAALVAALASSPAAALPPSVTPVAASADGAVFEVAFDTPVLDTVDVGGRSYVVPSVPGCVRSAEPGQPDLPARFLMAAVPEGARVTVTAERLGEIPLSAYAPAPVPRRVRTGRRDDGTSIIEETSEPDPVSYGTPFPAASAWTLAAGRMRDLPVVRVLVSPLRYDPQRGTSFAPRVRVTVRWSGGTVRPAPKVDPVFAAQYDYLLVNPDDAVRFRILHAPTLAKVIGGDSFDSSPNGWTKIYVAQRGFQRLTYQQLQSAAVAVSSLDAATVRLFNGGGASLDENADPSTLPDWMREVAVRVEDANGNGVFEPGDALVFFGQGVDGWADDYGRHQLNDRWMENEYTSQNVYWLTWGGTWSEPVKRIGQRSAVPSAADAVIRSFPDRAHFEQNRNYDPTLYEAGYRWEKWWYQLLLDEQGDPQRAFGAPVADPDTTRPMRLWARFWGENISTGTLRDHFLRVAMNGQVVDERSWNGLVRQDVVATGNWGRANNVMTVTVPLQVDTTNVGNTRRDLIWLAWYEIDFTHKLRAPAGILEFSSPDTTEPVTLAVTGLAPGASYRLFDVTDRFQPVELTGADVRASSDGDSLAFQVDAGAARRFALVRSDKYLAPVRVAEDVAPATYLRDRGGERVDYIIVTYPDFAAAAGRLRDLRETHIEGIDDPRAEVVSVDDIYDEFSGGLLDATAIRNFLEWAYQSWGGGEPGRHPTYVLFLGDATFDPRDFDQDGARSYVLAYENERGGYAGSEFVTDDWYSFFDGPGDLIADMFAGRLPASNAGEADVLVGKTVDYEKHADRSGWSVRAILCADDVCQAGHGDPLGTTHIRQTETLDRKYLPRPMDRVKVYLTEYGTDCSILQKPTAQADLLRRIEEGAWILDYTGHGGALQLADEQLLVRQNVASMHNADRLLFFVTASCIVGKFDTQEVGLGEAMVKQPGGGSVASFAATQLASADENEELNNTLMKLLFPRGSALADTMTTIGFATVTAKNVVQNATSFSYFLQGDPALRLAVPRLRVDLERTDPAGARAAAPRDTLLRGELVSVHGTVRNPGGGLATDFNGRADLLAADSEALHNPLGNESGSYYMPGAPIYRGDITVTQGEFDASFVVPRVLSSEPDRGLGRIRVHVASSSEEGLGVIDSLYMSTQIVASSDTAGPVITFLDFQGGDLRAGQQVHLRLEDPSGINITQIQESKAVTVTVEDKFGTNVLVTDLSPQLVFVDGYQQGEVAYTAPGRPTLVPGETYTLAARAADSQGNLSIVRQDFTFVIETQLHIRQAFAFPSPTSGVTGIFFEPSEDTGTVTVKILTVAGRTIRTLRGAVQKSSWQADPIPWDGRDEEGDLVANGVYFFKIEAKATEGNGKATAIGKAVVFR